MKNSLLIFSFLLLCLSPVLAQQTGEVQGRVVDENGEGIPFANVAAYMNDVLVTGAATDFDGNFTIKPLSPGKYRVTASYLENQNSIVDVAVSANRITFLPDLIVSSSTVLDEVVVQYKEPPVDVGRPEAGQEISREQIEKMPKNNLIGIIGNTGGTYQSDDNSAVSIGGSRFNATKYILDGVDLSGSIDLPTEALDQIQVITSGVGAEIGDFTGGVVNISTRGPSNSFSGSAELVTSQFLDPYGYNEGRVTLLGPIWRLNRGTDSARTALGYLFSGELLYRKDTDPPATPIFQVREDVLAEIQQNPLRPSPTGSGLEKSSDYLTFADLEALPYKPNNWDYSASLFGKLDWKPSLTTNFTLGSTYYYRKNRAYIRTFSLLNSENNPITIRNDYRVYGRFFQRFPDRNQQEEDGGFNISNAYYTIQADFQKIKGQEYDEDHGMNPFAYGYVGDYEIHRQPFYLYSTDDSTGIEAWRYIGQLDTAVDFTPGTHNPLISRYTEMYYDNNDPSNLTDILLGGGLRNGDFGQNLVTYSMYYNPGFPYTSYGLNNSDQYGMRFDASFDIEGHIKNERTKHAIQFGFEYQQQVQRSYTVSPLSLWTQARQYMNFHLQDLDFANPYYLVQGDTIHYQDYNGPVGTFDTIFYFPDYAAEEQYHFDAAVRQKLGLPVNSLEFINVDGLDPDFFELEMFSPDELLNSGNRRVSTLGYDYYGNKFSTQPSFNDFFTAFVDHDGDGEVEGDPLDYYTRPIAAYRPIYTAGYLQDRFQIGRVTFRVGVRVDRFDANQKVLRDQYSLYPIHTVSEVADLGGNPVEHPNLASGDWKVYVDDIQNPNAIVGYRAGDQWYDAQGNEVFDPAVLANQTTTGTISPYLIDPTSDIKDPENFDPDASFEDYSPQYTAMPRIAFSFPITETAMFTAHYDVLTQRPLSGIVATPYQYFFMQELAIDGVLANPNLRPEKTINYQLGFQQAINDDSRISLSAFYKELRDMTQIMRVDYAYPVDYTTFGNVDFGTVKGLTVGYDMIRRIRNILLNASYTLQFADATGSNATSQVNLVGAGQPNLRTIVPLDYDVRHTFNINVDYRFAQGPAYTGPRLFNRDILASTGINVSFRGRSGEPFTQEAIPTPTGLFGVAGRSSLEGSINGARLPWNFRMDARLDKDFSLRQGDNPLLLNVYLLVQNVFDTRNVVNVYPYTGSPYDDAYLEAPSSQGTITGAVNPQSYIDLYRIKVLNPSNFSLPRRIQLGVKLRF